ncbi:hypothetical protein CANARDRAFT_5807 [[Candida] arabinofermentans NRRL YB-2248]|uniref:Uncharacterized protein n=1 Tax=[Candida] arabinofermentans NRRL YB-2248 TaxID=983967 RepID=A0A1E4T665_9ASCO|nr:hypothetical protein CANARDRAFT_5807 [[Candida] arabinofermentans NRRL YB-2248]
MRIVSFLIAIFTVSITVSANVPVHIEYGQQMEQVIHLDRYRDHHANAINAFKEDSIYPVDDTMIYQDSQELKEEKEAISLNKRASTVNFVDVDEFMSSCLDVYTPEFGQVMSSDYYVAFYMDWVSRDKSATQADAWNLRFSFYGADGSGGRWYCIYLG